MITWVITGGVSCGKSLILEYFSAVFAPHTIFFSADSATACALRSDQVLQSIETEFGSLSRLKSGDVDKQWLRFFVFPDPELRRKLERILHPLVLSALENAREQAEFLQHNLFLAEVPLHYEIGATVSADFVIVVASSRSVQVRRMIENRGLDELTIQKFLEAQWPIEAKVERADAVIWNDGSLASLQAQLLTLASPLLQA